MLIRPLSDRTLYAPGGKFEPTAANFPSCKLFLPMTDAVDSTVIRDVIGGRLFTLPNGFIANAGQLATTGANADLPITPSISVGGDAFAWVVSCVNAIPATTAALIVADASEYISVATTGNVVDDGPVAHASGVSLATGETHVIVGRGGSANSIVSHKTTLTTYTAGTPVVATPGNIDGALTRLTISGIATIAGIAFFKFAGGMPSTALLRDMLTWTHAEWTTQTVNKGLYPGLKGVL